MGLVMLGTASDKAYDEMLSYARETQHEKIIRSLSVGIAFLFYGQRERAETVIEKLSQEKVCLYLSPMKWRDLLRPAKDIVQGPSACGRRSQVSAHENGKLTSRTRSYDTVPCSPLPSHTPVQATTAPSVVYCMSLFQT